MTDAGHIDVRTEHGAPSWRVATASVEAFVSCQGGHLAPVTFQTRRGPVQPFALAPWSEESLPESTPGLLRSLRGDFFCAPFGGNAVPHRGERHPPHGETASATWTARALDVSPERTTLVAELNTTVRTGHVAKLIELRTGETNVYVRHTLSGFSGRMPIGHHAMLAFPEGSEASLAFSPSHHGRVCPRPFEDPAQGGYSALKTGAAFRSLSSVPLAAGGTADLTTYPARPGFDDLVMFTSRGAARVAWATATVRKPGYVWFSLKDPRTLASTLLWHSNGGRHYPPWSGRHRRVLGIEEATSYFHFGLSESVKTNALSARGVPTALALSPKRSLSINLITGVVAIPPRFDRVQNVKITPRALLLQAASGIVVEHPVDLSFLAA